MIHTEREAELCLAKAGTLDVVHKIFIGVRRTIEKFFSFRPGSCNHTALSKGMRYILAYIRV